MPGRTTDEHFDRWQFDDIRVSSQAKQLASIMNTEDMAGMRIMQIKPRSHIRPTYLKDRNTLLAMCKRRLRTTPKRRRKSLLVKWLDIINLYYTAGWSARDISSKYSIQAGTIERILQNFKK